MNEKKYCPHCNSGLTIEQTNYFITSACLHCLQHWVITHMETCCSNPVYQTVKLITSNQTIQVRQQCTNCGELQNKNIGGLSKDQREALPAADTEKRERKYQEMTEERRLFYQRRVDLTEERRKQESAEWWKSYNAYLSSPKWKEKRSLILKRDNYLCQACLRNPAEQVHHRSYEFVDFTGREPCFDLISICTACHDHLHAIRDKKKAS